MITGNWKIFSASFADPSTNKSLWLDHIKLKVSFCVFLMNTNGLGLVECGGSIAGKCFSLKSIRNFKICV